LLTVAAMSMIARKVRRYRL